MLARVTLLTRVNARVFSEAVLDLCLPELYPGNWPLFLASCIPPQITEAPLLHVPSISLLRAPGSSW